MTFTARYTYMRSCQWKFGFIVIKISRCPGCLAMTGFAGGWKIRCLMIWISRCIIICKMASHTGLRCSAVIFPFVTGCTIIRYRCMCSGYCIIGIVLGKFCWFPSRCCRMAAGTIGRYISCVVIGIDRCIKIFKVITCACCRSSCVRGFMTFTARYTYMGTR